MQISLDELLTMLVSRVEEISLRFLELSSELDNQKSRFNIMFRMLYKKGLFDDALALEAIREENKIMLELGLIKAMPSEEALAAAAENLMLSLKGDAKQIRPSMEELQKKLQAEQAKRTAPKIDVAPAGVLNELDRLGGANGGKKLIL